MAQEMTKDILVSNIYMHQKGNSKRRGHRPPEYTKQELKEWLFSQSIFHEMYSEWKMSGYEKSLIPSCDRENNNIHYCFSNISLVTWAVNFERHKDSMSLAVMQYTKEGAFIKEWKSSSEVAQSSNSWHHTNISRVCNGKRATSYGYIWKWKKDL